ncbi:hypothetical protein [Chitinophaga silvisoli]|uniref:Uncharacterized protein n=1 Tax=Chitinophaga silvisoli TaxID=2291814 RepID=A0A3E1NV70_9BACT|nr:hypothetical protein [Chitinophaga silvisoli]RFM31783.1 hypothetical protein DXN04_26840 [Chitinophaga silvisoli]
MWRYLFGLLLLFSCRPGRNAYDKIQSYRRKGYQVVYNCESKKSGNLILNKDNVRRIKRDKILRRIQVDLKNKNTAFISGAEILAKIREDVKEPVEMVILDGEPYNMQEMSEWQVERSLRLRYKYITSLGQMPVLHPFILIVSGNYPVDWPEAKAISLQPTQGLLEN